MKRFQALLGCAIVMLFVPNLVFGQPKAAGGQQATVVEKKDFSLSIGGRAWYSTGKSDFNFGGFEGVPALLSDLRWDDLDSIVAEFTADMLFQDQYILTIDGGFGAITDGTLTDDDFLPVPPFASADLFSRSTSTVDGCGGFAFTCADDNDMWFVSVMLGSRVLSWNVRDEKPRSYLALMIGYQHWTETYVATKFVQEDPLGLIGFIGPFPDQGKGITESFTWDSLLVGVRTEIEILPDFEFKGRFMAVPFTHFSLEDIHHMRTDLRKDPSGVATADGGIGVILDATLSYNFWRGFSIEAGYQYWNISAGEGTININALTFTTDQKLNEANSTRHGAIAGISYSF